MLDALYGTLSALGRKDNGERGGMGWRWDDGVEGDVVGPVALRGDPSRRARARGASEPARHRDCCAARRSSGSAQCAVGIGTPVAGLASYSIGETAPLSEVRTERPRRRSRVSSVTRNIRPPSMSACCAHWFGLTTAEARPIVLFAQRHNLVQGPGAPSTSASLSTQHVRSSRRFLASSGKTELVRLYRDVIPAAASETESFPKRTADLRGGRIRRTKLWRTGRQLDGCVTGSCSLLF